MENKKIVDYRVCSSYYYDKLESEVVNAIKNGWILYRELKVTRCKNGYADALKYTQAMVKEEIEL